MHPRALAVHRYLFRLALAAGNIFGWIVVFRVLFIFSADISAALILTVALYAFAQTICFFLTPLAGSALRLGARRSLILGTLALALSFAFLAQLFLSPFSLFFDTAFWLIAGFVVLNGISRALYFVPYATAVAHVRDERSHALLREFSLALVPFAAGLLAVGLSLGLLFAIAAALALAAALAVMEMPNTYERFDWSYRETFTALFSSAHRGMLGIAVFDGLQGTALLILWPLIVFIILFSSFVSFGAAITATFLFAFAVRALARGLRRPARAARSPYVLAALSFSSWLLRIPAGTPLQIVAVDALYHSAAPARERGIDVHAFDQSADNAHYVDERSALKEMGHCLGRIAMCLLFIVLASIFMPIVGFVACIVAAATAAAASVLFSHRLKREAF